MKTINNARSDKNGIIFYSSTQQLLGVKTYIDEAGQIHSIFIPVQLYDIFDEQFSSDKAEFINSLAIIAFDFALIAFCMFYLKSIKLTTVAMLFSANVSKYFFFMIKRCWALKLGNKKSIARFHSAEHMAINAYQTLQHIPNLEEIKMFSRFSTGCGSRIILNEFVIFIMVSVSYLFAPETNVILFLLTIILTYIFSLYCSKKGLFTFMQILLTSKPTDAELLVAIKGLEEFEKMERLLQNNNLLDICQYFGKSIPDDF